MPTGRNKLRDILHERRVKAGALAEQIGMKPHALRRYVRQEADPRYDLAEKIAKALGVTPEQVLGRDQLPGESAAPTQQTIDNIPVFGAAQGGVGADITDVGSVVEYIPRPVFLGNVTHAFAVYIVGDSMEPRFYAGETAYVHPGRPPKAGDYVIVQLQNGDINKAVVKRYVRDAGDEIILEQHNPSLEIRYKKNEVSRINVIVGVLI